MKQSAFLLIKTNLNATRVLGSLREQEGVVWAGNCFGPYQVVAYLEKLSKNDLINSIESIRAMRFVTELDARFVKIIPEDVKLSSFKTTLGEKAVLLINVNYREEKERVVANNLRGVEGVKLARAMWGPTDIIAIVEASNHEEMRNLICDKIKTLKGVKENSTLYCY